VITRERLAAALYAPAPPRQPRQNGRPRTKGRRLPTLAQVWAEPATHWQMVTIAHWYGRGERRVQIPSATAVWYHTGLPPVPIHWVLSCDPEGKLTPQALLSTKLDVDPVQRLTWFIQRWQLETTFEEARAHLGIETSRPWNDRSGARTTPLLCGLYSGVTLTAAHLRTEPHIPIRAASWYSQQRAPFADTMAVVRRCLWSTGHFSTSGAKADVILLAKSVEHWYDASASQWFHASSWRCAMLRPMPIGPIPPATARVARAAFPKGNRYLLVADALEMLGTDDTFLALFPTQGQPAQTLWQLALVTILQFAEGLADRQAAHGVRRRLDWQDVLRLELPDPGFDASVLSAFRGRLIAGAAEYLLFETLARGAVTVNSSRRGVGSGRTPPLCWRRCGPSTASRWSAKRYGRP
jgi:transposase